jgi:EAL domain-containing protein (putative c-di-GMP-specific phosphodiesterase class I)/CHASE2 domain-containing sensor protein
MVMKRARIHRMRKLSSLAVTPRGRNLRALLIIAVLGLMFGLLELGEIGEGSLRVARNNLSNPRFNQNVVLVAIDDRSQRLGGVWPWRRSVQARMIRHLDEVSPRKILLDITYDNPSEPAEDKAFAAELARSGKVVLPARPLVVNGDVSHVGKYPLNVFRRSVELGNISTEYNYAMAVWSTFYGTSDGKNSYPSYASIMTGAYGPVGEKYPIDYRYRFDSIPTVSAVDVLNRTIDLHWLKGRTVIVGPTASTIGDQVLIPGRGRHGGVYTHIYAAQTLMDGRPVSLGWFPSFLIAMLATSLGLARRRARTQFLFLGIGAAGLLSAPIVSEPRHIFMDIMPGLFMVTAAMMMVSWRRYRASAFTNSLTGLPNLNALKALPQSADRAIIVGRIFNYAQLASNLSAAEERTLVEQIVSRLSVGSGDTVIHHGDDGVFAWLASPGIAIGHHIEALHALFRSPARIGAGVYDLAVTFGVEIGSARRIANRLGSALVAADEAASEGLKWKYYDPDRSQDDSWRLSLLTQLDQAIDQGQVWVAYQPQLDLATGRTRGAEALARWTHPEKGPISPTEFITAAEQHGRIDRLTLFIMDKAIATAAEINRRGLLFQMSVNLSARTLARRTLIDEVRDMLGRHQLHPARLTLELTETAAMANEGSDLDMLLKLRELGVQISIDDYGTGLSTLEYLKKIPASEIKIDQSFVRSMCDNRSDLVMVQSTIALAHSLGRTVVAEGVENRQALDALRGMDCDTVQGFLVGRPTSYDGLIRRLEGAKRVRAA